LAIPVNGNQAVQSLRVFNVQQKVSGCFPRS
jgi:hypothetical protein